MRMNSTTMDWTRTSLKTAVPLNPDASMSFDLNRQRKRPKLDAFSCLNSIWFDYERDSSRFLQRRSDWEHIHKPEQIGSPNDGQVPGVHVGLRGKRGHSDKMLHQILQSPDEEEGGISRYA